jgi:hypothetical protein
MIIIAQRTNIYVEEVPKKVLSTSIRFVRISLHHFHLLLLNLLGVWGFVDNGQARRAQDCSSSCNLSLKLRQELGSWGARSKDVDQGLKKALQVNILETIHKECCK